MPEQPKIIREFKCTKCGASETVTGLALQPLMDNGKIPKDTPYALRREPVPLLQPSQVALTAPVLVVSWDICAKCGTLYPVRAEVVEAPITSQQVSGKGQSPFGFGGPLPPGGGRG